MDFGPLMQSGHFRADEIPLEGKTRLGFAVCRYSEAQQKGKPSDLSAQQPQLSIFIKPFAQNCRQDNTFVYNTRPFDDQ